MRVLSSTFARVILGRRLDRLPRPRGWRKSVFGRIVTLSPVRAPIDGISCAVCSTAIAGFTKGGVRVVTELVTGHDFLLRTEKHGLVQVRVAGAVVQDSHGPPAVKERFPDDRLSNAPELLAAIERAGIVQVTRYCELALIDGDRVTVRGILREELASPEVQSSAYRGGSPSLPTLTGAGGRLDITFDDRWVVPMRR